MFDFTHAWGLVKKMEGDLRVKEEFQQNVWKRTWGDKNDYVSHGRKEIFLEQWCTIISKTVKFLLNEIWYKVPAWWVMLIWFTATVVVVLTLMLLKFVQFLSIPIDIKSAVCAIDATKCDVLSSLGWISSWHGSSGGTKPLSSTRGVTTCSWCQIVLLSSVAISLGITIT